MTGYTRQSIADIIPGADVDAAPLNDEFDALQDAFDATTGHIHDGSSGNGPKINLTTSVSAKLPIANMDVTADAALLLNDADVPRLGTANTWTGVNTFTASAPVVISSAVPTVQLTDTDTGVDHVITGNSTTGSLAIQADINSEGSAPVINLSLKGTNRVSIADTATTFNDDIALASNKAISFAGTGAATTRTNLGLGTSATVNTGTSGPTVPLLNGTNTWSGIQTFGAVNGVFVTSTSPAINLTDTDTGVDHAISANSSVGNLYIQCDVNSEGSSPQLIMSVKGTQKMLLSETGISAQVPINMASNQAISFAGTGAATTRTNLGLGTSATVNTGTTGATIPLLNASNTWSNQQTFSSGIAFGSGNDTLGYSDSTNTYSFESDGTGSPGTIIQTGKIRLVDTTDASLTSTAHAFQIGPDSGANLIIDNNEIMVRNNGVSVSLYIQSDGGDIILGDTTSNVYLYSSILNFGTSSTNDAIRFSDTTNNYIFEADGSAANSKIVAGSIVSNVDADGAWTITDDAVGASLVSGALAAANSSSSALILKRLTTDGVVAYFRRTGSTNVGNISVTTSATTYNTSSDIRLKYDFQPINPDLLDQIKVYDFGWKNGDGRAYGVIAQELVGVIPQAVNKGETEEDMWSVDYSKLVPLLIATVQELKKEVAELKEKLNG